MTGVGNSILSDPHRLSGLLLMAFAFVGLTAFIVVKSKLKIWRPRLQDYKQYDILKRPDALVPEQD